MNFLYHGILILFYLTAIIIVCSLFTNAIEPAGSKMKLGNNAIGGILAVIGTTLPETVVPIVAIISSFILKKPAGFDIAQGAILGSPFMLSTFGLFLIGLCLLISGRKELEMDKNSILRFYKYFLFIYIIGISSTFISNYSFKVLICLGLITSYFLFIKRTIAQSKETFTQEENQELFFCKIFGIKDMNAFLILLQIFISLIGLFIFSHFFVREISVLSKMLNFNPVILSLIITPFATELPECINGIIWTKSKKDDLAFTNIMGASIFQAVIPMSIGILFTPWIFDKTILLNSLVLILCSFYLISSILMAKKAKVLPLLSCIVFYAGYIIFILLNKL